MIVLSGAMAWHPQRIAWIRSKKYHAQCTLDYGEARLTGIVGTILCLIRTS
jgi:hypothetical protein